MKTRFFLLFLSFLSLASYAQNKTVLLYPEYQKGTIYMNGNQEVRVPLNYDAGKHCVMYQQNGENMILMNVLFVVCFLFVIKEPMEQYRKPVRSLSISPLRKDKSILPINQIPNRMFTKPETTTNTFY